MNHLLALALLGVDCLVRAWRIQLAVWTAGGRLSFTDAFRLNLYGVSWDAASPYRFCGRAALLHGRLPADPVWRSGIPAHAEPSRRRARPLSGPARGRPATGHGDRRDRRRGRLRMARVRPRGGRTDSPPPARRSTRGPPHAEAASGPRAHGAPDHPTRLRCGPGSP